jgi:hypothetical protein
VGDTTHSIVYVSGRQLCPNYIENASYNNISDEVVVVSDEHTYNSNGFCTYCGETETASLNEDGFYEIANYGQLVWFAEAAIKDCNINGLLVADITANEGVVSSECNSDDMLVWKSFGTGNGYYGIFDGAGHTISGLYCSTGEWGVSFVATNHGTIKNVNITNSYFEGNGGVGAVCGINCGTITACSAVAEVVCTLIYPEDSMNVGGICGYNSEDGVVEYCYSKGSVSGNTCGGIAGGNYGKISNCYTLSTVSGDSNVGVICGTNEGSIDNCYYIGSNSAVATDSGTTVAHNMTTEDFASGSVCYALNTGDNVFFYQTLSGEDKDESPVLDSTHRMVFKTSDGYINYKLGDVDLNGSVEKTDSAYLLRYLCGADTTALIRDVADVNRDGVVDMLDAVAVVKIAG